MVPEITHLRAGNYSDSRERRKQRRLTSMPTITTSQESSAQPQPVSSLLKGLIRRKDKNSKGHRRETKISNAVTEKKACKSTLCIGIAPSRCSLSKEQKSLDSCDVAIVGILVNRRCFLLSVEPFIKK